MTTETQPQGQTLVSVTPAALAKLKQLVASQQADQPKQAFRLGVLGGGCAGLQYDMQPTTERTEGDFVQELEEGVCLYIHPVAAAYLKGTTIDYADSLIEGGFKFINPNATNTCGCGTSFGIA
jgi:iron-sulfur cluster assembly protein